MARSKRGSRPLKRSRIGPALFDGGRIRHVLCFEPRLLVYGSVEAEPCAGALCLRAVLCVCVEDDLGGEFDELNPALQ